MYHVDLQEQVFLHIATHIISVDHALVIDSARNTFGLSYLVMLQMPSKVKL